MRVLTCLIALLFITGCGMLNNTTATKIGNKQLLKQYTEQQIEMEKDWIMDADAVTSYSDSVIRNYTIQLWPTGNFTFSPEKGFAGEANHIMITGSSTEVLKGLQTASIHEVDKGTLTVKTLQKDEFKSDVQQSVKARSVSWKLIITAVILSVILGVFLYLKFFRNLK